MSDYTVYKHTTPSGKVYIGMTGKNPEERWRNGAGYRQTVPFARAIKKYGWDNIRHEIMATGLTRKEACATERRLIKEYDATNPDKGYNCTTGGEHTKLSPETRQKIARSLKALDRTGERNPNFGNHKLRGRGTNRRGGPPSKPIRCVETGIAYESVRGAATLLNIDAKNLSKCANGKRETVGGYHWEFIQGV